MRPASHCCLLILTGLLTVGFLPSIHARPDKNRDTACFWQRDPDGDFDNGGANNCAPVSVADGLVYLQEARGHEGLADSTDHDGQIAIITELVGLMNTDPKSGTNTGQVLAGLLQYAKQHGFSFKRLEATTWRGVGDANRQYLVGKQPDIDQLTVDADDRDTVVLFNFGWYQKNADGTYKRTGGHWVNVVGTGEEEKTFRLHNPLIQSEKQRSNNEIALEPLDDDATCTGEYPHPMSGNYQAHGPGLPTGGSVAVLDGSVVFQLERE